MAMWNCGGGRGSISSLATLTAPTASIGGRMGKRDDTTMPDPNADPTVPPPDGAPNPPGDPAAQPNALTISIVGSFGTGAFSPNPIQAMVGDMIVWTNADRTLHHIVLDDGSVVGDVAPGASSAPMALKTSVTTYYCTIHPSMFGSINGSLDAPPDPGYGSGGGYDY